MSWTSYFMRLDVEAGLRSCGKGSRKARVHGAGKSLVGFVLLAVMALGPGCVDTGVSELIERVEITRMPYPTAASPPVAGQICSGDVVRVKVTPKLGPITQIDIDGYPGDTRYLQFNGRIETLDIVVTASVLGRGQDVVREEIEIGDCVTPDVPTLRVQPSLYVPFAVDFVVVNHAALAGWQEFHWDFGDGESEVTHVPYVQHSYEAATDGQQAHESFEVTLANGDESIPGRLVRKHRVSILDYTRIALEKGIVQPRAWATAPLLEADGKWVAEFRIRNTRGEPFVLTHATESQQPCADQASPILTPMSVADILFPSGYDDYLDLQGSDEDAVYYADASLYASALESVPAGGFVVRPSDEVLAEMAGLTTSIPLPAVDPSIVGSLVIPHRTVHSGSFVLEAADYGEDICVLGYHFRGVSGSGLPVEAELYYQLRPDPSETQTVTDAAMLTFLGEVVDRGWVSDPSQITTQDLFRLQQSGLIRQTGSGWEIVGP